MPPDTDGISGRGSVFYDIEVHEDLTIGTEIKNHAGIYFDFNEPIITNEWFLKADNYPPESHAMELPDSTFTTDFTLHWTGNDLGSGIKFYDVMYRENEGNWYFAASQLTDTFMVFNGEFDHRYEFYTVAYDEALNKEAAPVQPDAQTWLKELNTSINDKPGLTDMAINIWPNPVEQFLHIDLSGQLSSISVRIVNTIGATVMQKEYHEVSNKTVTLDLQTVPSGVYILYYKTGEKIRNSKIIKL